MAVIRSPPASTPGGAVRADSPMSGAPRRRVSRSRRTCAGRSPGPAATAAAPLALAPAASTPQRHVGAVERRQQAICSSIRSVVVADRPPGRHCAGPMAAIPVAGPVPGVVGPADDEHRPQQQEDSAVGAGGGDDGDPLPYRLAVESQVRLSRRHGGLALVEHLHVAAERDRGDPVLGAVAAHAPPEGAAEADREAQHLDPVAPGHPVVAKLVEGHEDAEADHTTRRSQELSHGGGSSDGTRGNGLFGVAARARVDPAQRLQ